jgi:hypothetical protein
MLLAGKGLYPTRSAKFGSDRCRQVLSRRHPDAIIPVMSSREERLARNEAAAREINEGIEDAHEGEPSDRYIRMVCECGRDDCDRLVAITTSEYEQIRSDPVQFAVVQDHVIEDVERVVYETDRFLVVAKREGTPAAVAIEEDPRT